MNILVAPNYINLPEPCKCSGLVELEYRFNNTRFCRYFTGMPAAYQDPEALAGSKILKVMKIESIYQ